MIENNIAFDESPTIKAAWDQIFAFRPEAKIFLDKFGALTLAEYGKEVSNSNSNISERLKSIINNKVEDLFGTSSKENVEPFLEKLSSIDTSSHGGIFSEDTLVQSHMILASSASIKTSISSFVSFACGVVPMNNSTWPRGYFRNGERESIFPKSFDRIAVHEATPFTKEMLQKKIKESQNDSCSKEILEKIDSIDGIYLQSHFFKQATLINNELWRKSCSFTGVKNFYHLLLEDITSALVIKSIEEEDALSKLIFCVEKRELLIEVLSNLPGTWSIDRQKGTFLFWHSSGDFRAASLFPLDKKLSGKSFEIEFTPENIIKSLKSKQIVPSVFLSLVSLLYNGVHPSGGYNQLSYLPEYARRLSIFANSSNVITCPYFLSHIASADLFHLGYGFVFKSDLKSSTRFSGIDSFYCDPLDESEFQSLINSITVKDSIIMNSKRWYNEIVPTEKRTIVL